MYRSDEWQKSWRVSSVLGLESDANIMDLTNLPDSPKSQHQHSKRYTRTPKKSTTKKVKSPIGKHYQSNTPKKGSLVDCKCHKRKRLSFENTSTSVESDVIILEPEVSKKCSEGIFFIIVIIYKMCSNCIVIHFVTDILTITLD